MNSAAHDIRPEAFFPGLQIEHVTAAGVKALRVGSGPTLLLLHGGTGSWTHWVRNIEPLSRRFSLSCRLCLARGLCCTFCRGFRCIDSAAAFAASNAVDGHGSQGAA